MLPAFIYQIEFNKHGFSEETSSKTWNTEEVMILWKECAIQKNEPIFVLNASWQTYTSNSLQRQAVLMLKMYNRVLRLFFSSWARLWCHDYVNFKYGMPVEITNFFHGVFLVLFSFLIALIAENAVLLFIPEKCSF